MPSSTPTHEADPPNALGRAAAALAFLSLAAYVAVMTIFRMSNNDIWIHLETGAWVLDHGWVPLKDPYSFTAADHDYVAHEWLAAVVFHLVHAAAGVNGLIFLKAGVVAAACVLLYRTARILGARTAAILPSFALAVYLASARFIERPHIFSYLFAALYLWIFFGYRSRSSSPEGPAEGAAGAGGRRARAGGRGWLYALPALHVLWTNLHGGHVQGLLLLAVFALGETLALARAERLGAAPERALPRRDVALLWGLVPACVAAALVNPYGYRLLTFPFTLTGLGAYMQEIYEWLPPYDARYNTFTMFVLFLALILLTSAAYSAAFRDTGRGGPLARLRMHLNAGLTAAPPAAGLVLAYLWFQDPRESWTPGFLAATLYVLLGLFCLFTLLNLRTADFTLAGLFALLFLLAMRHNRATADAALGMFVILAASATIAYDRSARRAATGRAADPVRGRTPEGARPESPPLHGAVLRAASGGGVESSPAAVVAGSLLLIGIAALTALYGYRFDFKGLTREKGLGVASNVPVCALDFIRKNGIAGNAFVAYTFAGPLIHWAHPAVKVGMDSRNDVYGERLYQEHIAALTSPEGMRAYLERWKVDFFFLPYVERVGAVFDALEAGGAWAPIYCDDRAFILVRRTPETEELIRREEYKVIRAGGLAGPTTVDASSAPLALEEADRAIRNCPESRFGWFYRTRILLAMQRYEEAVAAGLALIERDPGSAGARADVGTAYAALGRREEAIGMFEKALAIRPDFERAREGLRRLRPTPSP